MTPVLAGLPLTSHSLCCAHDRPTHASLCSSCTLVRLLLILIIHILCEAPTKTMLDHLSTNLCCIPCTYCPAAAVHPEVARCASRAAVPHVSQTMGLQRSHS
jgi:hypothetical protein